jgi:hypothetical protein
MILVGWRKGRRNRLLSPIILFASRTACEVRVLASIFRQSGTGAAAPVKPWRLIELRPGTDTVEG